ncbi:putative F-box protein At1g19160 [Lycium barbarum]|uniref:putative F-box protein At1g19160 n=1 Tax=Lycium barbarum TaxID=112863 RepID=UPI00293F283F|nr:putative F-box protein At1g19160 [Lycium barbarum]
MTRPGGTKLLVPKTVFYTLEQTKDGKASLLNIEDFDGLYGSVKAWHTYLECVNGLFCFWTKLKQCGIICNPSTGEVRLLPYVDVDAKAYDYSLGFEPEEKVYKGFFMKTQHTSISDFKTYYTRIWVFTLGKDESWKEIKSIPAFNRVREGVCIDGVIYMFNCLANDIVAFNVKAESFCRTITLWEALYGHELDFYNLMEVKRKLSVLEGTAAYGEINFWILGKGQHIILDFPLVHKTVFFDCWTYYDGEIIIGVGVKNKKLSFFSYDIARKSWREFEVHGFRGNDASKFGFYKCVESLFPIRKKLQMCS